MNEDPLPQLPTLSADLRSKLLERIMAESPKGRPALTKALENAFSAFVRSIPNLVGDPLPSQVHPLERFVWRLAMQDELDADRYADAQKIARALKEKRGIDISVVEAAIVWAHCSDRYDASWLNPPNDEALLARFDEILARELKNQAEADEEEEPKKCPGCLEVGDGDLCPFHRRPTK